MKRILFLVAVMLLAIGLMAAPALAGTTVCKVGLYAGQHTYVGALAGHPRHIVAPSLTVKYDLKAGYKLKEVHLAVAHDAAGIPGECCRRGGPGQVPTEELSVDQRHDVRDRVSRTRAGSARHRRARGRREPLPLLRGNGLGHDAVLLLRRCNDGRFQLRPRLGEVGSRSHRSRRTD